MRQPFIWVAGGVVTAAGCAAVPPLENPVLVRPSNPDAENPILVAPGVPTPDGYMFVYERVLVAVDDYFETVPGDRYSGEIQTKPTTAGGFEQPWKGGTPDARERLIATLQSVRHRAVVRISPGERGGFRVSVQVYKELEDVFQPDQARTGPAAFRNAATRDLQSEVVGPAAPANRQWIPVGRDPAFEQVLLRKIQVAVCR